MINLSPTKVDTFYGCRRLYLYKNIYKLPSEEKKYFFIGNVAHKVLELFHSRARDLTFVCDLNGVPGKVTNGALRDLLMECWKTVYASFEFEKKITASLVTKDDALVVRDMLKSYLLSLRGRQFPNVVQLEKLHKLVFSNFIIWPKADRIDGCGNNAYKIVDYKTSQRPASAKDELESVQIPTYGLVVKQQYKNAEKIYGEYQYLRCLDSGGIHVHEITEEFMREALEKYKDVANKLEDKGIEFYQNKKYKYCRTCEYSAVCAADSCDRALTNPKEVVDKFKKLGVNCELQKNG